MTRFLFIAQPGEEKVTVSPKGQQGREGAGPVIRIRKRQSVTLSESNNRRSPGRDPGNENCDETGKWIARQGRGWLGAFSDQAGGLNKNLIFHPVPLLSAQSHQFIHDTPLINLLLCSH